MNEISSRGADSRIVYVTATNAPDAYSLSGRYQQEGEVILVRVNIKQGSEIKHKFETKGNRSSLMDIISAIVEQAEKWVNQ